MAVLFLGSEITLSFRRFFDFLGFLQGMDFHSVIVSLFTLAGTSAMRGNEYYNSESPVENNMTKV